MCMALLTQTIWLPWVLMTARHEATRLSQRRPQHSKDDAARATIGPALQHNAPRQRARSCNHACPPQARRAAQAPTQCMSLHHMPCNVHTLKVLTRWTGPMGPTCTAPQQPAGPPAAAAAWPPGEPDPQPQGSRPKPQQTGWAKHLPASHPPWPLLQGQNVSRSAESLQT